MLPPFAEHLDADKIHVQAPVNVIFICGGKTSAVNEPVPISIRDAFLKIRDNPALKNRRFVQAEDINPFYLSRAAYSDFLKFEVDLAQITELIVLFCESSGSFVELGAFSMLPEIAERLLVVLRDSHYSRDSFVRLGPVLSLQNTYGDTVVCVIEDEHVNMINDRVSEINLDNLRDSLTSPITNRIDQIREPTTFDSSRSGHIIKLIVGLIQEYGALTSLEIEEVLISANVLLNQQQIQSYLLCAEALEWIKQDKKGIRTFYFSLPIKDAATLSLLDTAPVRQKVRRRQGIRDYWRENDPTRYRGIVQWMGGAS